MKTKLSQKENEELLTLIEQARQLELGLTRFKNRWPNGHEIREYVERQVKPSSRAVFENLCAL